MLEMAESFLREEFLVIIYSRKEKRDTDGNIVHIQDAIPEPLVRDQIKGDRIRLLKSMVTELQQKLSFS